MLQEQAKKEFQIFNVMAPGPGTKDEYLKQNNIEYLKFFLCLFLQQNIQNSTFLFVVENINLENKYNNNKKNLNFKYFHRLWRRVEMAFM